MNKTIQAILAVAILSAIGAFLKYFFGFAAKAIFAGAIVFGAITISIINAKQKASLRRKIQAMTPEEIETYIGECRREGLDAPVEQANEIELSWTGKTLDVVLGVTAAFGPPLAYHIARGLPLSWDSEFTGWHVLWMGIGVAIYMAFRKKITTPFMTKTELPAALYRRKSASGAP